jgi:UPI00016E6A0B related cluster
MPRAKLAGGISGKASRLARLGNTLAQNAESDEVTTETPITTPETTLYQEQEIHEDTLAQEENSITTEQEILEPVEAIADTEDNQETLYDTETEEVEETQEEYTEEETGEDEPEDEDYGNVEDEPEEQEVTPTYGYYQEDTEEETGSDYMPNAEESAVEVEDQDEMNTIDEQATETVEPAKEAPKVNVTLDALTQVKLTIALVEILSTLESADLEGINILLGNPTSTELAETVTAIVSDPAGTETLLETVAPLAEIDREDTVLAAVKYYALLINEYDESTQRNLATILLDEAPEDATLALESLAVALAKAPASIFDVATQIRGALQGI